MLLDNINIIKDVFMCKKYFGCEPWEDDDRDLDNDEGQHEQDDDDYRSDNDPY